MYTNDAYVGKTTAIYSSQTEHDINELCLYNVAVIVIYILVSWPVI